MIINNKYFKLEINTKKIKYDVNELIEYIITLMFIGVGLLLAIAFLNFILNYKKIATDCESSKNRVCNYYEVSIYSHCPECI